MKTRLWLSCFVLFTGSVLAETPAPAWGTATDGAISFPASSFTPRNGVAIWGSNGAGNRYRTSQTIGGTVVTSDLFFDAPVDLPAGAKVTGMRFDFCDTNTTVNAAAYIQTLDTPSGLNPGTYPPNGVTSSGAPGCASLFEDLSANNIVLDRTLKMAWIHVALGATDSSTQIRNVILFYRLQVSPAPATATFADVPVGSPFHRFVEAIAAAGITGGCGGGNYCPDAPITRGQMAVFLSAALGLHWAN